MGNLQGHVFAQAGNLASWPSQTLPWLKPRDQGSKSIFHTLTNDTLITWF